MADERGFVTKLMKAIEKAYPDAFVWKPADAFNLGIPDIHAALPPDGRFMAAEVKQIPKLCEHGDFLKAHNKEILEHRFTGPQISMLRRLHEAGVQAYGIVRTHQDIAYRIKPHDIPLYGNFTPRQLMACGHAIFKADGWKFWEQ